MLSMFFQFQRGVKINDVNMLQDSSITNSYLDESKQRTRLIHSLGSFATMLEKDLTMRRKDLELFNNSAIQHLKLSIGVLVRLKPCHNDHEYRGKHFKVENIEKDLITASWQNKIYYFCDTDLEIVEP